MNKQYREGVQKWKKDYLIIIENKMVINMCLLFHCRGRRQYLYNSKNRAKEDENRFLGLSWDTQPISPFSKEANYLSSPYWLMKVQSVCIWMGEAKSGAGITRSMFDLNFYLFFFCDSHPMNRKVLSELNRYYTLILVWRPENRRP